MGGNHLINRRSLLMRGGAAASVLCAPNLLRAASTRELRLAHIFPTTHPYHLGLAKFAEEIEARTNGAVTAQVFPSAQLGGEIQILEGMNFGLVDGGAVASGSIPSTHGVNRFHLLDMPYLLKDYEAAERFATGEVGQQFREGLPEEAGFRILGYGASGFHQMVTRDQPVVEPKDVEALKLRVWEAPGAKLALELLGANPTPMAYAEVFSALQQGVVDGLTNSLTTLYQTKMYEVTENLAITRHAYVWVPMVLSESAYQSVGEAERKEIDAAGEVATAYWRGLFPKQDAEYEAQFKAEGLNVTQADQAKFRQHVEGGYDRYASLVDGDPNGLIPMLASIGGY
ncbi:MAG: hypothetical protein CMH88_11475 [Oceanibulbus sp.]|jgi:tripartite ATP-independent transporter DctP family solute receptor|nr:hypothetical protein [Sulfitobacter sp.]